MMHRKMCWFLLAIGMLVSSPRGEMSGQAEVVRIKLHGLRDGDVRNIDASVIRLLDSAGVSLAEGKADETGEAEVRTTREALERGRYLIAVPNAGRFFISGAQWQGPSYNYYLRAEQVPSVATTTQPESDAITVEVIARRAGKAFPLANVQVLVLRASVDPVAGVTDSAGRVRLRLPRQSDGAYLLADAWKHGFYVTGTTIEAGRYEYQLITTPVVIR